MLKKIFVVVIVALYFIPIVLADSRLIPQELSLEYKTEVERTIKAEIPKTKRDINIVYKEVKTEQNPYIKRSIAETGITSVLFEFYKNLADITNKYATKKLSLPDTDWYLTIKTCLAPYLKENDINTKPIDNLLKYAEKKQKKIKI